MSFLKAEWRKLLMANYVIDSQVLNKYIPYGTELDLWNNNCYMSVVGFMFHNTKVLGLKIPFHVNFEEVNLRFYVKRKVGNEWRRGVVFIKEIVPKAAITFVANTLYNENYETLKMDHTWSFTDNSLEVYYQWHKKGRKQAIKVTADRTPIDIPAGSEAEFIMEHYWGYAHVNKEKSTEYEVTHPKWQQYKVTDYQITIDFKLTYGSDFAFLNDAKPHSVTLAEGSEITVEGKSTISS